MLGPQSRPLAVISLFLLSLLVVVVASVLLHAIDSH